MQGLGCRVQEKGGGQGRDSGEDFRFRISSSGLRCGGWGGRGTGAPKKGGLAGSSFGNTCAPPPFTLHHTPYTLHPYNLRPTPYTLHPTPYTLHSTPHTLHPTPYTLHPTPYTLHPQPWWGGVQGRRCREAWRDPLSEARAFPAGSALFCRSTV